MKIKIIDKCPRSVLTEGRNYGMGFALVKPLGDDTYETVQPISPCKDYLNDVVYSEWTGNPFGAWGLSTTKRDIFGGNAFMLISICKMGARSPHEYGEYKTDVSALADNLDNLLIFMNWWDNQFKLAVKTSITKVEDNLYLVEFDKWWTKATYRISLYSLLLRIGMYCKTKAQASKPNEFMGKIENADRMMISSIKGKIDMLLSGKIPVQDMNKMAGSVSIHDAGIQGSDFSNKSIFPSLE